MRARSALAFAALLLAGCNVVLGLEDHQPFPPGSTGGANGAAASNGEGGSSASSQGAHANAGTGQGASSSQGGSAFGGTSNGGSGQGASSASGNGQGASSQSGTGLGASSQGGSGQGASSQGGNGQTGGTSQGGGTSSGGTSNGGSSAAGGSSSTGGFGGSGNGTGTGGSGTGASSQGGASSNACHDGVPVQGQPCFDTVSIATGAAPKKALVADFDQDGRDDVFVLEQNAQFELFTSQGTSFGAAASGVLVSDLLDGAVGHLDAGPYPDVVVARAGNTTDPMDLCVILNRLDPTTNATTCFGAINPAFVLDSQPQAMALADVTGDGLDDVVMLDQAGRLRVLRNDGTGTGFVDYQTVTAGTGPLFLAVGVDATQTIDAVVASAGDHVVGLWKDSNASLTAPNATTSRATGKQPAALAIGFLEGTAYLDFAIADASDGSLWIYDNIGGILATNPKVKSFALTSPTALAIGDLDGDGRADLAVARTSPAELDVVLQPTTGTYVPYSPGFTLPGAPAAAVLGDANGDSIYDAFVTVPAANSVTVLLSAP